MNEIGESEERRSYERRCLRCDREFMAPSRFIRTCEACKAAIRVQALDGGAGEARHVFDSHNGNLVTKMNRGGRE